MYDYEYQWSQLMRDNLYTEDAVIQTDELSLNVKGIYYSGSYEEDSPAPYAPKEAVDRYGFQISSREIPEEIEEPTRELAGATLLLPGRNRTFRILAINGNEGGVLTLRLQRIKEID